MGENLNFCVSCGLCCNGTLIGFVQLETKELPALRELLDIEEVDDKGILFQPCKKYSCDGCMIYSDRPKKCAEFKCAVLTSVENEELEFESAIEIIEEIKQKRLAIEKQLVILPFELQSMSFYFKILELNNLEQRRKLELSQEVKELQSHIKELNHLIFKSFGISYY